MVSVKEGESEAFRVLHVDSGPCWPAYFVVDAGD